MDFNEFQKLDKNKQAKFLWQKYKNRDNDIEIRDHDPYKKGKNCRSFANVFMFMGKKRISGFVKIVQTVKDKSFTRMTKLVSFL